MSMLILIHVWGTHGYSLRLLNIVLSVCLPSFSTAGLPKMLKTDHFPAYMSDTFKKLGTTLNIANKAGIPYNPQGQRYLKGHIGLLKFCLEK